MYQTCQSFACLPLQTLSLPFARLRLLGFLFPSALHCGFHLRDLLLVPVRCGRSTDSSTAQQLKKVRRRTGQMSTPIMRCISRKRSIETLDKTLADAAGFHMNSSPFAPPALSTRKNVYLLNSAQALSIDNLQDSSVQQRLPLPNHQNQPVSAAISVVAVPTVAPCPRTTSGVCGRRQRRRRRCLQLRLLLLLREQLLLECPHFLFEPAYLRRLLVLHGIYLLFLRKRERGGERENDDEIGVPGVRYGTSPEDPFFLNSLLLSSRGGLLACQSMLSALLCVHARKGIRLLKSDGGGDMTAMAGRRLHFGEKTGPGEMKTLFPPSSLHGLVTG